MYRLYYNKRDEKHVGGVVMLSFIICFALLLGGYFVYCKVVENTVAPDDRETPAVRINYCV